MARTESLRQPIQLPTPGADIASRKWPHMTLFVITMCKGNTEVQCSRNCALTESFADGNDFNESDDGKHHSAHTSLLQ